MEKNHSVSLFELYVVFTILGLICVFVVGCVQSEAKVSSSTQSSSSSMEITSSDILDQQHRSHEAEEVEAGKTDDEGEPIDEEPEEEAVEEEYYDYDDSYYSYTYTGGYTGGSTATDLHDLTNGQGRAYDENGTSYTYYYDVVGDLDIPGEHKDENGVSYDGDGYIVVAADGYDYGDVVDTPYGEAKVYDKGSGSGNIDIYVG